MDNSFRWANRSLASWMVAVLLMASSAVAAPGSEPDGCEAGWIPTFGDAPGTDGAVAALVSFDDGSGHGSSVFVGGTFTVAGGHDAPHVARWDGQHWSPVGTGLNGPVAALAVFDDGSGNGPALYAAGAFTQAGTVEAKYIAKWNGAAWTAVGGGLDGPASALLVDPSAAFEPGLVVGGQFLHAGGVSAPHIARWQASGWSTLGSGMDAEVSALAAFDDRRGGAMLHAGGSFTSAGGQQAFGIARWDGSAWSPLSIGLLFGSVKSLAAYDDGSGAVLIAGGNFLYADYRVAKSVAKWDGSTWSPLASGLNGVVSSLASIDFGAGPELLAGGTFGGGSHLARWSGASWQLMTSSQGPDGHVGALRVLQDRGATQPVLLAGGSFANAGGTPVGSIARWDGQEWSPLGSGLNNEVFAATSYDDGRGGGPALYLGGAFTVAGGSVANHVVRWDGASWSPLGSGTDGLVTALTVFDDGTGHPRLIAAGYFGTAGGPGFAHLAAWDGASWSPLGAGTNDTVHALAVFDDGSGPALYAGGSFTTAGGAPAKSIARWDGTAWSPVGRGLGPIVWSLAALPAGPWGKPLLVAGGSFTSVGGVPMSHLAAWDGSTWSPLGEGVDGTVYALQAFDDGSGPALVAGGEFSTAGGLPASAVARWDGAAWTSLGLGVGVADGNAPVRTLLAYPNWIDGRPALYAGGLFTTAGGQPAHHVAIWNGSAWSGLGDGVEGYVRCLAGERDSASGAVAIIAGGPLTSSDGDVNVARWQGCSTACPADLDGNGQVDAADLAALLGAWATHAGDVTGDGTTDAADLAVLLGAWGPCP